MERNPNFLKQKYDLHNSPEVGSAAKRTEVRARVRNKELANASKNGPLQNEKLPQDPSARIQNYLDRFKEIIDRKDENKRERGLDAVKHLLHREYIIDVDTATEQYLHRQKRIAHEQGHGELDVPSWLPQQIKDATKLMLSGEKAEEVLKNFPNEQKQLVEEIVALVQEQKTSLDNWVDYVASPDATYPDWLKYWTMRNIVGLAKYDKDKKVFPKRVENTTNPFPDLNREALAYVLDAIEKKYDGKKINLDQLDLDDRTKVEKLLGSENFAKLYAWAIEKVTPASVELLTVTDGQWIKYNQGSDHNPLTESLQNRGTGWCTAGESVAQSQLSRGDFWVYYSLDEQKKPTIPRAAIRMEGTTIAEVRGIAQDQNLDRDIAPVVAAKMKEFPDGTAYEKKAEDMKQLTMIEHKVRLGQELTKDDLIFLYEINSPIEGFGYQRDPRITELRKQRDLKVDAPIVFGCEPHQIASNEQEIMADTKAYIGKLFPGIFKKLNHLDHIYSAFPEGKIRQQTVEVSDKTPKELLDELKKKSFQVSDYAKYMMEHMVEEEVETVGKSLTAKLKSAFGKKEKRESEQVDTVRLTVRDFGFSQGATTAEVLGTKDDLDANGNLAPFTRGAMTKFGLEFCQATVGPEFRMQYTNQPINEWLLVGMKPIAGPDGDLGVFGLHRVDGGLWLKSAWAVPGKQWNPEHEFMFPSPQV